MLDGFGSRRVSGTTNFLGHLSPTKTPVPRPRPNRCYKKVLRGIKEIVWEGLLWAARGDRMPRKERDCS
jgi:hypothetical protein